MNMKKIDEREIAIVNGGDCECNCFAYGKWFYQGRVSGGQYCQWRSCLAYAPYGVTPEYDCLYDNGYRDRNIIGSLCSGM